MNQSARINEAWLCRVQLRLITYTGFIMSLLVGKEETETRQNKTLPTRFKHLKNQNIGELFIILQVSWNKMIYWLIKYIPNNKRRVSKEKK